MIKNFIPIHGGYQRLVSYQKSEIIFDATMYFTKRFLRKGDRTIDQMVQAARSGKQNIAEGSVVSGTSKEFELNLTNVARASLEELLIDYQDFLRIKNIEIWDKNHRYALRLKELNQIRNSNYETFRKGIENIDPAICVNVIIGLIKVTNYLLDRQIRQLEKNFLANGGIRERMKHARLSSRQR